MTCSVVMVIIRMLSVLVCKSPVISRFPPCRYLSWETSSLQWYNVCSRFLIEVIFGGPLRREEPSQS